MATGESARILCDESSIQSASYVVRPHPLPPPSVHFLSNIDLAYNKPELARIIFFFRDCFSHAKGAQSLLNNLKASLSKTLSAFPILAGRLAESSEPSGKLVVDVRGQGIHFVETTIDSSFRDWQDLRLCPVDIDLSLDPYISDVLNDPLVKILVTQFKCGGLAITVHFVHTVVDGYSLLMFLHSWAEIHRGTTTTPNSSFTLYNGHSFLAARNSPAIDAPVPLLIDSTDKEWTQSNLAPYNLMTLRMERSAIEECKREVKRGSFAYEKVTGFEAVSSMLWSSILRTRGIPHNLDASFIFPVNLRGQRYNVPPDYFGNAVATCQVYTPQSGNIVGHDFSYAARLIHKAKLSCNRASVQSMLDWLEMNPGAVEKQLHWKRGLMSTSIANFSFYDINFGWRGGSLSQFCFLPSIVPPNMSFAAILPTPKTEAVDIAIGLENQDRDKLFEDTRFTSFFSPGELKLWTGDYIRKALKKVITK